MRCEFRSPRLHFAAVCLLLSLTTTPLPHAQISFGRPSGRAPTSPDAPKFTLTGRVINSATGEPIFRALVQVYTERQTAVFTDREGLFEIPNLPAAKVLVDARKPGFFSEQQLHEDMRRSQIQFDVGPTAPSITIQLVPEGVITGRITGENGEPLDLVAVTATHNVVRAGRKLSEVSFTVTTDDQGDFRLAGLKPGTYYVATSGKWDTSIFLPGNSQKREAYPPVFYPGVAELAEASPIEVSPGKVFQLELSVKPAPVFLVSGIVSGNAAGQPVFVQVHNGSHNDSFLPSSHAPNRPDFQAFAFAGSCTIVAGAQSDPEHTLYAERTLNLTADIANLSMELSPMNSIPINVRVETTKPQEKSRNGFPTGDIQNYVYLMLHSLDRNKPDQSAGRQGNPPTMALRGTPAGKYTTEINALYGLYYVQSAFSGAADLSREVLTVVPGGSEPIEIVIRDDGATLKGTVQDSGAGAEATLIFVPERSPLLFKVSRTNQDGNFQQGALAPGDYKVFAFDNVGDLEYANPEVLKEFSAHAALITLQADQTSTLKLDVIRRGK